MNANTNGPNLNTTATWIPKDASNYSANHQATGNATIGTA
jgi:hypothetical protein